MEGKWFLSVLKTEISRKGTFLGKTAACVEENFSYSILHSDKNMRAECLLNHGLQHLHL